jgi:tetratricopeptide (TPR) repeat protein
MDLMQTAQMPAKHELLIQATRCVQHGEFEQAIVLLKSLIQKEPRHELAIGMLGGVYAQIKMHDCAVDYFREVLAINPDNALARFQLGLSLLTLGRPQEAITAWKPLLANANDYLAHFYSALALFQVGRPSEAKPLLNTAAARMPKNHEAYPKLLDLLSDLGIEKSS